MIDDAARIAAAVDAAAIEAAVNAGKIEAAVDAAAALIGLPIAPAHRPGVLQFHALAASMAQVLMAQPLARDDESGAVFHPVEPAARDDTPPETVRVCRLDSQPLWESEAREGKRQHTEDFSPSEAALAAAGACGIAEAVPAA